MASVVLTWVAAVTGLLLGLGYTSVATQLALALHIFSVRISQIVWVGLAMLGPQTLWLPPCISSSSGFEDYRRRIGAVLLLLAAMDSDWTQNGAENALIGLWLATALWHIYHGNAAHSDYLDDVQAHIVRIELAMAEGAEVPGASTVERQAQEKEAASIVSAVGANFRASLGLGMFMGAAGFSLGLVLTAASTVAVLMASAGCVSGRRMVQQADAQLDGQTGCTRCCCCTGAVLREPRH